MRLLDCVDVVDATYIVMERVDGPDLIVYMERFPLSRLPPAEAQRFFAQLLTALAHAHSRGFLHCDVKPLNIRLSAACDHAVLTDWGLSYRIGDVAHFTSGTPAYAVCCPRGLPAD